MIHLVIIVAMASTHHPNLERRYYMDKDGSLAKFVELRKSCARVVCESGYKLDCHEAPPSSQDEAAPGSSCSSPCRQLVTGLCTSRLIYMYKARIYVWLNEYVM